MSSVWSGAAALVLSLQSAAAFHVAPTAFRTSRFAPSTPRHTVRMDEDSEVMAVPDAFLDSRTAALLVHLQEGRSRRNKAQSQNKAWSRARVGFTL